MSCDDTSLATARSIAIERRLAASPGVQPGTRKRVLNLALPAVGEQVLNMMVGIADSYLVGHLGAAAISAVGLANQGVMLAMAFYSAVGTGATALVARHTGSHEPRVSNRVMHQGMLMGGLIGVASMLLFHAFAEPIVVLLNAPADVIAAGSTYLQIVSLTFPISALMFIGMASLRGTGDTRSPMIIMGVVNLVNIVVAYAFIYGLGPIPALGVAGSAVGAASGRAVGGVIVLLLLWRGRSGLHLGLPDFLPDIAQIKRILNIGLPAGVEMLLMRTGQTAFAMVVAGLGTAAFAAHQLAMTSESLSFMPGFGFSVAATTLVGQGLGARDPRAAEEGGYESLRMAAVVMGAMGLAFIAFAPQIIGLFTTDREVIELGVWPLRIVAFSQPALAASMVLAGGLRGAGDTRRTLVITAAGLWLARVPLALLLTGPFGLVGAWLAMSVDLNLRGLATFARFRSGNWKHLRV